MNLSQKAVHVVSTSETVKKVKLGFGDPHLFL